MDAEHISNRPLYLPYNKANNKISSIKPLAHIIAPILTRLYIRNKA